jgi:4'-phosphopantetheinyl transferase EntD
MTWQRLLEAVRPPDAFAAGISDCGQKLQAHPLESAFIAKAAPKRQREFILGRACARAAMAALGQGEAAIARKDDGGPLWPDGVVGSISHADGFAVALSAPQARFRGLGVDVERQGRVVAGLYRHVFGDEEIAHLVGLPAGLRDGVASLMFSAKEACCKLWLGLHGGPQPFTGIRVTMAGADFTAGFPARGYRSLQGRAASSEGLVLAAAWEAA